MVRRHGAIGLRHIAVPVSDSAGVHQLVRPGELNLMTAGAGICHSVGRSHDDIVEYQRLWQNADARFGAVAGYTGSVSRLPAPALPTARLRPRPRNGRKDS